MKQLIKAIGSFFHDDEGVTAIEYALIAALIAIAVIAMVTLVGSEVNTVFMKICNALKGSGQSCP